MTRNGSGTGTVTRHPSSDGSRRPPVVKGGDTRRLKEVKMHDATTPNPLATSATWLGAERLQVYHVALEFLRLAAHVAGRASAPLRDQLDRASASIVLNVAEGGRFVAKLSA